MQTDNVPAPRQKVFNMVNAERIYQEGKWGPVIDRDNSVAHWVLFMEHSLNKAKEHLYLLEEADARTEIRKICALAVACMEHNDTKPR